MANHLTLPDPITVTIEANTVEEALGRLSNQHGTAAKIVRADRVRKGGFAGFFTREVVEIEAEVTSEGPGVAGAFDRMLAAAEREEMSEAALPKSERAPARTLSLPGPDLMAGANWDGAHMRAIGLPDPIVSALGDLTPDDDIGHVTALSVALSAVCGPLPTGPARLIGDRSDRLRGAVPLEESETGYIHLVVGDYLPDSLPGVPAVVSWVSDKGAARAISLALGTGARLGYGMGSGFGAPARRVAPVDAALAIRELMERS